MLLIDSGCSLRQLLWEAVTSGSRDCFDYLLSHGADINEASNEGETALHRSVANSHLYFTGQLLTAGADLSVSDCSGQLPLARAIGSDRLTSLLLAHGSPTRSLTSHSALLSAVESGSLCVVGRLLAAGADPDNAGGRSPLDLAVAHSSGAAVRLLLAAGARAPGDGELPAGLRGLFADWHTDAIETAEREDGSSIRHDFRKLKADAAAFLERAPQDGPLTPLLGEVNRMVVRLTKLATSVEQRVRQLRLRRQSEIGPQFEWLARRERNTDVRAEYIADEKRWRRAIADIGGRLEAAGEQEFPGCCAPQLREYLAGMEAAAAQTDKAEQEDEKPGVEERNRRGRLLYLNGALVGVRAAISSLYELVVKLCARIGEVLEGIERTLSRMVSVVVTQQQMNFDFEKVHAQASVTGQTAAVLQDRKELLTLDRALVSWEKQKFVDVSAKILRLLRHCFC